MGPHHLRKKLPPSPLHTTRIHPKEVIASSLPTLFPKMAVGVEVITIGEERLGERIWMGGDVHGVEVTHHLRFFHLDAPNLRPALFTALRALDGARSIAELTSSLDIPIDHFARLLCYLEEEGLIHFHSERLKRSDRSPTSWSPSTRGQLTRREIESVHLPRKSSLKGRTEQSILIVSDQAQAISPIATSVAALLFGSGFTRIKFVSQELALSANLGEDQKKEVRSQSQERVSDRDLGLSIFYGSDAGARKHERLQELAHRSAILPLEVAEMDMQSTPWIASDFDATLIISIGYPRPDHHQRWVCEDRTFMIVPGYSQREVRIGPIVIPGRTPCLRCYELNQVENDFWREQSRQLRQLEPAIDPPKVASHLIASLTALYATLWLDAKDQERMAHLLVGQQVSLSFDSDQNWSQHPQDESEELPAPMQVVRWQNHPECGCLWLAPRT